MQPNLYVHMHAPINSYCCFLEILHHLEVEFKELID